MLIPAALQVWVWTPPLLFEASLALAGRHLPSCCALPAGLAVLAQGGRRAGEGRQGLTCWHVQLQYGPNVSSCWSLVCMLLQQGFWALALQGPMTAACEQGCQSSLLL